MDSETSLSLKINNASNVSRAYDCLEKKIDQIDPKMNVLTACQDEIDLKITTRL